MDSIVNGEIYIKYKPLQREPSNMIRSEYEENKHLFRNQSDIDTILKLAEIEETVGLKDYFYCNQFWVALVEDGGVNMVNIPPHPEILSNEEMFFTDKKELDNTFVSLTDVLNKGQYIGKQFIRTEPNIYGDYTYMDESQEFGVISNTKSCIALYRYRDVMIVKNRETSPAGITQEYYGIINESYLEDGQYEFRGEYTDMYKDKDKVYSEINQQLIEWNKSKSL